MRVRRCARNDMLKDSFVGPLKYGHVSMLEFRESDSLHDNSNKNLSWYVVP